MKLNKKVQATNRPNKLQTDNRTYHLQFNIEEKTRLNEEQVEETYFEFDEIVLTKSEFEYYNGIKDFGATEFVCELLRDV